MTNIHRERWDVRANPKGLVEFDVDAATEIEVGDLVWVLDNDARPASATSLWTGGLDGTQRELAMRFAGIAMSAKSGTSAAGKVRVATRGTFSMPVDSAAAFEIGDLVKAVRDASNNYLLDQEVGKITGMPDPANADQGLAIGVVNKRYSVATSIVEFDICTKFAAGGGWKSFLTS